MARKIYFSKPLLAFYRGLPDEFKIKMAERAGFEPAVRFPVRQFSKLLLSATQPPLRFGVRFKSAPPRTLYDRDCDHLARRMPSSSVNEMYLARFSRAR